MFDGVVVGFTVDDGGVDVVECGGDWDDGGMSFGMLYSIVLYVYFNFAASLKNFNANAVAACAILLHSTGCALAH